MTKITLSDFTTGPIRQMNLPAYLSPDEIREAIRVIEQWEGDQKSACELLEILAPLLVEPALRFRALTTQENQNPHASEYPVALSRVAWLTLCGPQGYLYAVDLLVKNPLDPALKLYLAANRPKILFGLGLKFLSLAFRSIAAQAKGFLRTKLNCQ